MNLCIVGVFCVINCYFKSVYRIRCRFLYIWSYFKNKYFFTFLENVPEVRTIFVRTIVVWFFVNSGEFWVLNGLPPFPSPASMSKFPSRRKRYGKMFCYWFVEIVGDLWSPPTTIPGVNVKVPFRGKNMWKNSNNNEILYKMITFISK